MARADTHTPLADGSPLAEAAVDAFLAGLAAGQPDVIVKRAVRQGLLDDWLQSREKPRMISVLAIGKGAPRMLWGLVEGGVPFRGLGVAPRGVPAPGVDTFRWLVGDHPVVGPGSLAAGRDVLAWCDALPADEPLLVLLSGGSSACLEVPAEGLSDAAMVAASRDLLAAGLPIEELNRRRAAISAVKGGKLGAHLLRRTGRIRVWVLADTDPATAAATIGSALFWQDQAPEAIPHHVLASVTEPIVAAGLRLGATGWSVYRHAARISGPIDAAVAQFAAALAGLPADQDVALVGGGEAVLPIPPGAPAGGRAQHAALAFAGHLHRARSDALVLCAATDGVDGTSDAAGAWVTSAAWSPEADAALRGFDSHAYLTQRRLVLHTGPTGTNLNDLWIALRRAR
ncbi:MAG: DUF4147 domain-containing protein [bacterium]